LGAATAVEVGDLRHEFATTFEAAVWLLSEYATAGQIQELRGDLGRALLKNIPIKKHPAAPWWGGH
jgi:hypothetical protein